MILNSFLCPVCRPLEKGHEFIGGVGRTYFVNACPVAEMGLAGFHEKDVAAVARAGKGDGYFQGQGEQTVGIAGEGEGRIGRREEDAAVHHLKSVEHLVPYPEMQLAIAGTASIDLQVQPLGKPVIRQHMGGDGGGIGGRWVHADALI